MAKAMKDNSPLVDVARVYAEAGFNNLSLKAVAHIDTLDDQLVALRWFEFNDGTELRLDDTGKAQLVKIAQQHFPIDEFWRQSLNAKAEKEITAKKIQ